MKNVRLLGMTFLAAGTLMLGGCLGAGQDDLAEWMAQQRATVRPRVEPVAEPKAYVPQDYRGAAALSPFSEEKLTVLLRAESGSPRASSLIAAEMQRRKEPLEAVPLDAITMVGLLNRDREVVALVQAENLLYQVRVGNYLGTNYGRITGITETQVTLREIVQDAAGEWIERTSVLQLQEATGK